MDKLTERMTGSEVRRHLDAAARAATEADRHLDVVRRRLADSRPDMAESEARQLVADAAELYARVMAGEVLGIVRAGEADDKGAGS